MFISIPHTAVRHYQERVIADSHRNERTASNIRVILVNSIKTSPVYSELDEIAGGKPEKRFSRKIELKDSERDEVYGIHNLVFDREKNKGGRSLVLIAISRYGR